MSPFSLIAGELSSSVTGSRRVFVLCDLRFGEHFTHDLIKNVSEYIFACRFCGAASDKTCRHCKVARICGECRPSGHCAEASAVNQQATKFTPLGTSNELLCRATLVAAQVVAGTFKRVSGHDKRASTGLPSHNLLFPAQYILARTGNKICDVVALLRKVQATWSAAYASLAPPSATRGTLHHF